MGSSISLAPFRPSPPRGRGFVRQVAEGGDGPERLEAFRCSSYEEGRDSLAAQSARKVPSLLKRDGRARGFLRSDTAREEQLRAFLRDVELHTRRLRVLPPALPPTPDTAPPAAPR